MVSSNTNGYANCEIELIYSEPINEVFFCIFLVYEPLIVMERGISQPEVRIMAEMCKTLDYHKWTNGVLSSQNAKLNVDTRDKNSMNLREAKTKDGFMCEENIIAKHNGYIWQESKSHNGTVISPLTKSKDHTAITKQWSVHISKMDLLRGIICHKTYTYT